VVAQAASEVWLPVSADGLCNLHTMRVVVGPNGGNRVDVVEIVELCSSKPQIK